MYGQLHWTPPEKVAGMVLNSNTNSQEETKQTCEEGHIGFLGNIFFGANKREKYLFLHRNMHPPFLLFYFSDFVEHQKVHFPLISKIRKLVEGGRCSRQTGAP